MSEKYHPTGRQIAAARALIGMSQPELAKAASISIPTLRRMEACDGPASGLPNNVLAIQSALEAKGISFIGNNENDVGVRKLLNSNRNF